jgi:hypothetical protein
VRRFAENDALSLPRCDELQACKGIDQFEVHHAMDRG